MGLKHEKQYVKLFLQRKSRALAKHDKFQISTTRFTFSCSLFSRMVYSNGLSETSFVIPGGLVLFHYICIFCAVKVVQGLLAHLANLVARLKFSLPNQQTRGLRDELAYNMYILTAINTFQSELPCEFRFSVLSNSGGSWHNTTNIQSKLQAFYRLVHALFTPYLKHGLNMQRVMTWVPCTFIMFTRFGKIIKKSQLACWL